MLDARALEALIQRLRGRVDEDTWEFMDDFFRNGEYGLAVETLCDRLEDAGLAIPEGEVGSVREIGESMGLERDSFRALTGIAQD